MCCLVYAFASWLQSKLTAIQFRQIIKQFSIFIGIAIGFLALLLQLSGKLQWTGRSLTLLDPTYASKYIPIIASVSEHQPSSWSSFYMAFGPSLLVAPLGLYFVFEKNLNSGLLFLIIYSSLSWYFAGIMNRLILTLAPAACILSAIGISEFLVSSFQQGRKDNHTGLLDMQGFDDEEEELKKRQENKLAALNQRNSQSRNRGQAPEIPATFDDEDVIGESLTLLHKLILFKPMNISRKRTPGLIALFASGILVR